MAHAWLVPWNFLRSAYRKVRGSLFTRNRTTGTHFAIGMALDDIEHELGSRCYAPNWEVSYNKRGEVLNLASVYHDPNQAENSLGEMETFEWWQTHVRGYEHGDEYWLTAHVELEPTETDREHILGTGFDQQAGLVSLRETLDQADIDYRAETYDGG